MCALNAEKTKYTVLKREKDISEKKWRSTKKLGTSLGDSEAIQVRNYIVTAVTKELNYTKLKPYQFSRTTQAPVQSLKPKNWTNSNEKISDQSYNILSESSKRCNIHKISNDI